MKWQFLLEKKEWPSTQIGSELPAVDIFQEDSVSIE